MRDVYQVIDGDELLLQVPTQVVGHKPIPANAVCTVSNHQMCPITGHQVYDLHGRVRAVEHSHTKGLHHVVEFWIQHTHYTKVVTVDVTNPVLYSKVRNEDGSQRRISSNVRIVKTTLADDDTSADDKVYQ